MAWYRVGTVAVTNGSPVVTGTGTAFVANVQIGHAINLPDGKAYEVAAVSSDTQITLGSNYLGATAAGQSYSIQPNQGFAQYAASAVQQFLTQYGGYATTSLAGRFGDGTVGAPGISFSGDQSTGLYRTGASTVALALGGVNAVTYTLTGVTFAQPVITQLGSATAPSQSFNGDSNTGIFSPGADIVAVATGGTERVRWDASGNVGIGTTTPGKRLDVSTGADRDGLRISFPSGATGLTGGAATWAAYTNTSVLVDQGQIQTICTNGATSYGSDMVFRTAGNGALVERMRLDQGGNMLIGGAVGNARLIVRNVNAAEWSSPTLLLQDSGGGESVSAYNGSIAGINGAATVLRVAKNSSSLRAISTPGTINASGADYAEYMTKAEGCGTIAKGDVCGVDASGKLTRSWAAALSHRIKSTAPNLVGGDDWASHLGDPPVEPAPIGPEPTLGAGPAPFTDPHPVREENEEDDTYGARWGAWLVASQTAQAEQATFDQQAEAFPALHAAWIEERDASVAAEAQYATDKAAFEAALEAARQKVDRIAYCGRVPVNFEDECAAGDYLIAVEGEADAIALIAVSEADMVFKQFLRRVGKVLSIGTDGRPIIDVQHG